MTYRADKSETKRKKDTEKVPFSSGGRTRNLLGHLPETSGLNFVSSCLVEAIFE